MYIHNHYNHIYIIDIYNLYIYIYIYICIIYIDYIYNRLNPIGCNKQTMPLIVLFYPLVAIVLEAAIMRHFMKFCKIVFLYPEQTVLGQLLLLQTPPYVVQLSAVYSGIFALAIND